MDFVETRMNSIDSTQVPMLPSRPFSRHPLRLALRADDAGLGVGVNRGILEVIEAGLVRNVSFMVPAPAFDDAVTLLGSHPRVEAGLHVTLNCEWEDAEWHPVSPANKIPSLLSSQGTFLRSTQELHNRGAVLAEIMSEVEAQLALARAKGLNIRYLDEHMGVGWLPGLRPALRDLAQREGLIHADDLAFASSLQPTLPDPNAFLRLLEESPQPDGYLILHVAAEAPSNRELTLPGNPSEMQRRITEKNLFCNPDFIRQVRRFVPHSTTLTDLAHPNP